MARKNQHHQRRRPSRTGARDGPALRALPQAAEKKPPVLYGKPFVILEDEHNGTFIYESGKWIPHDTSIAEYRQSCQVKALPQQINRMTRYEICLPLPARS